MKKISLILLIVILAISGCISKKEKVETNSSSSLMVSDALDSIKGVHPGTAGCSLKAMYAIKDIMALATSNEYANVSMQKYVDNMDKKQKEDFKESVDFVKESFDEVDKNDVKKVFDDQGIDLGSLDVSEMNYDYAKKFLDDLSDLVDRDFSND